METLNREPVEIFVISVFFVVKYSCRRNNDLTNFASNRIEICLHVVILSPATSDSAGSPFSLLTFPVLLSYDPVLQRKLRRCPPEQITGNCSLPLALNEHLCYK
jgi:hypothetical protein